MQRAWQCQIYDKLEHVCSWLFSLFRPALIDGPETSIMSEFSDATSQTSAVTGTPITTVWLPLLTAYPYIEGCSTEIYKPGGGSIFAWDPLYDLQFGQQRRDVSLVKYRRRIGRMT